MEPSNYDADGVDETEQADTLGHGRAMVESEVQRYSDRRAVQLACWPGWLRGRDSSGYTFCWSAVRGLNICFGPRSYKKMMGPFSAASSMNDRRGKTDWVSIAFAAVALVVIGVATYSSSFDGIFVFDDEPSIAS